MSTRQPLEVREWKTDGYPGSPSLRQVAEAIVAWVNANGGEAQYVPDTELPPDLYKSVGPRIAVRTSEGWVYAAPGDHIVKGTITFRRDGVREPARYTFDFQVRGY